MDITFNVTAENVIQTLLDLSNKYWQIAINLNDFVIILQGAKETNYDQFIPVTSAATLRTGHYGSINNMKIMVRKEITPGYTRIEGDRDGK